MMNDELYESADENDKKFQLMLSYSKYIYRIRSSLIALGSKDITLTDLEKHFKGVIIKQYKSNNDIEKLKTNYDTYKKYFFDYKHEEGIQRLLTNIYETCMDSVKTAIAGQNLDSFDKNFFERLLPLASNEINENEQAIALERTKLF